MTNLNPPPPVPISMTNLNPPPPVPISMPNLNPPLPSHPGMKPNPTIGRRVNFAATEIASV
jgi:hypothetical protein